VLSRKAELREVRERLAQIEGAWREMERESATQAAMLRAAQERVGTLQQRIDELAEKEQALSRQVDDHVSRLKGLETEAETGAREEQEALARLAHLVTESVVLESEKKKMAIRVSESADQASLQAIQLDQALEDVRQADRLLFETQTQLAEKQVVLSQVQIRRRTRIDEVRALVSEVDREETDARVEAIRSEKHHRALLEQLASLPEYYNSLLYAQELLSEAKIKHDESRRILVEAVHAQSDQAESRDQKSQQRQALELESARILMQLDELKRRAFDDYQFDLEADISNRAVPSHLDTDGAKIEDLRRQAQRLGTVNEEAVHELQELTERQRAFHDQMQDLQAARKGLLDLIDAANAEGSTRFLTVFHAVAGHFRDLFRKLFGGGQAELSLVDPANPLDCGIEVIAKPPGKDAASLSLMSGGERTMTAVALLLAVFRSCPSPFCVLDEVDAALDEANVGRFTDLLKEFSERTQFILITHHKRTMACADVLLGITMSEPGVSTRMAVKLDDWLGNGGAKVAA
jgi:chromosome segregation protein